MIISQHITSDGGAGIGPCQSRSMNFICTLILIIVYCYGGWTHSQRATIFIYIVM